jgi:uridine kinase
MKSSSSSYVVAVSSASGGGKTTLVRNAAKLLDATALYFDDYHSTSKRPTDMRKWIDEGADLNQWRTPQLALDLSALRRGQSINAPTDGTSLPATEIVLVEEPTGRIRQELADKIDFVALIDTPLEVALARRMLRNTESISLTGLRRAKKDQIADALTMLVGFLREELEGYLHASRDLYIAVQRQVEADCDLILNGLLPANELAQQLVTAVQDARNRARQ